ncbi:c-type cytochrome [Burkholderia anthina]|uniref:c-type cytochrome n=1 Tax=Burkholderia anthina TaxID=179879 RepID=UPI00158E9D84|nr:c-type cytochrome [Burkholderia anthina]
MKLVDARNIEPDSMNTPFKRLLVIAFVSGGLLSTLRCSAADIPANVQRILNSNSCSACHSKTEPVVGPAFDAVAAKYSNTPDAMERLARKVRSGGSGVWGQVAMPPNQGISAADLQLVLAWILKQSPGRQ